MDKKQDYLRKAIWGLEEKNPKSSLRLWLGTSNRLLTYVTPLLLITILYLFPKQVILILFILLNIIYLSVQLFKLTVTIIGAFTKYSNYPLNIQDTDLPIYTILLPVYKESKILKSLVKSISRLDYPSHLLDAKLLIEEDDSQTIEAVKKITLPKYFEVIQIPNSKPRTKPKSCNYGLQLARGKYVVIYDAEDRPNPKQLKQVVAKFKSSAPNIICIQARLNYYNRNENSLTKLFSIEYTLLFDYILKGLKKLDMPIPLGGTSNHFIRKKLEYLGAWDAFNVTEDADLGIRLYKEGYRTDLISSITLEESPIEIEAWITQRSRWIKGQILTSLLHLNRSNSFKSNLGLYLSLYLPNLTYLLLPVYFPLCILMIKNPYYDLLWYFNLSLSIILPIGYASFIMFKKKLHNSISCIFLSIFYQLMLTFAGLKAAWQIFYKPYHWDKTNHAVSKKLNSWNKK